MQMTGNNLYKTYKNNAFDHVTFLTKSRRFDSQGFVGRLAKCVINGEANESWQLMKDNNSQTLLAMNIEQWLPSFVKQYFQPLATCKNIDQAFELFSKFRILCATRVGIEGVENINEQVERILVKSGNYQANKEFYHGKPIMITQNDYGLGLFNGDIGLISTPRDGTTVTALIPAED